MVLSHFQISAGWAWSTDVGHFIIGCALLCHNLPCIPIPRLNILLSDFQASPEWAWSTGFGQFIIGYAVLYHKFPCMS